MTGIPGRSRYVTTSQFDDYQQSNITTASSNTAFASVEDNAARARIIELEKQVVKLEVTIQGLERAIESCQAICNSAHDRAASAEYIAKNMRVLSV